jgi:hypothetical protein
MSSGSLPVEEWAIWRAQTGPACSIMGFRPGQDTEFPGAGQPAADRGDPSSRPHPKLLVSYGPTLA